MNQDAEMNLQGLDGIFEDECYQEKIRKLIGQKLFENIINTEINSIEKIKTRVDKNYYFILDKFLKDIHIFFSFLLFSAKSKNQLQFLNQIIHKFHQDTHNLKKKFDSTKQSNINRILKLFTQTKVNVTQWPDIPSQFRHYQKIQSYIYQPQSRKQIIQQIRSSLKQPVNCGSQCPCITQENYCEFDLIKGFWNSKCPNRSRNIECNHQTEILNDLCKNQQIKKNRHKKPKFYSQANLEGENYQIEESPTWGIDYYTQFVILSLLPNFQDKQFFIQKALSKAGNLKKMQGYIMSKCLDFIIQNSHKKNQHNLQQKQYLFNRKQRKLAKRLAQIIKQVQPQAFRIHSKGLGVVCIDKKGIKKSTFIIEYYGQIYQPWRWFQRQDFTKKFMKHMGCKDIPDFYNIVLQKHKDDPAGYNILYIDPISKGNFGSRFSHSCNPNCGTISTISDGKYYIGMYALSDIQYGQQLTFDYCSLTEALNEQKQAVCLCGTRKCRGFYIQLSNSKKYNIILDKELCFLKRNTLLLKCTQGELTEQEFIITKQWNIWNSLLNNSPNWMKKWAAQNLFYIEKEKDLYLKTITQQFMRQKKIKNPDQLTEQNKIYLKARKNDLLQIRILNLVTSINKLRYYLDSIKSTQSPIKRLNNKQIFSNLWYRSECNKIQKKGTNSSIIQDFLELLEKHPFYEQIKKVVNNYCQILKYSQNSYKFALVRKIFLQLSIMIRKLHKISNCSNIHLEAVADILYMYSFTYTYFTIIEYAQLQSPEMTIHNRQIGNLSQNYLVKQNQIKKIKNEIFSDKRQYSSQYVWGQTIAWFKQTVATPQASLSQQRRGTLSYPTFSSFATQNHSFPFENNTRQAFLRILRNRSYASWPPQNCKWSYKNSQKMYGTFLFENYQVQQKDIENVAKQMGIESSCRFMDLVLDYINRSDDEMRELFFSMQSIVNGIDRQKFQIIKECEIDSNRISVINSMNRKMRRIDNQ